MADPRWPAFDKTRQPHKSENSLGRASVGLPVDVELSPTTGSGREELLRYRGGPPKSLSTKLSSDRPAEANGSESGRAARRSAGYFGPRCCGDVKVQAACLAQLVRIDQNTSPEATGRGMATVLSPKALVRFVTMCLVCSSQLLMPLKPRSHHRHSPSP